MCGIAGIFRFDGEIPSQDAVRRMTGAIAHRGPDGEGFWFGPGFGFGHRRLAVIDLSEGGRQPMTSASGRLTLTFNGEIYNYRAIRRELEAEGLQFRTDSDTEVLLAAIEHWGIAAALGRAIGMFAFGLADHAERTLVVCRDRAGVKPLYYVAAPWGVAFASEMRSMISGAMTSRRVDRVAVSEYLSTGYFEGGRTVFADVRRVPPGVFLTITSDGRIEQTTYWDLRKTARGSFRGTLSEAEEQLVPLADDAFGLRLVADVPVGLFLSGGIDSSLLAVVLAQRLNARPACFTIGFDEDAFDETAGAAALASKLGLPHTVARLTSQDALTQLSTFSEIYDEPFGDTSGIPTFLLSKVARRDVTVALSADGGDEAFAGYDAYQSYASLFQRLASCPVQLRRPLVAAVRRLPYRRLLSWHASRHRDVRTPQSVARFEKALDVAAVTSVGDLLNVMSAKAWPSEDAHRMVGLHPSQASAATGDDLTTEALVDRMMTDDFERFLREDILVKVDRASMAVSLECREPMLDHRLLEFARSLPMSFLFQGGTHKLILKRALIALGHGDVVSRPKRGFSIPLYRWLRGPWRDMVLDTLTPARVAFAGVLNPEMVSQELDLFYRYEGGRAERIWTLLSFQMWCDRWLTQVSAA